MNISNLSTKISASYISSDSDLIQQGSNLNGLYLGFLRNPADFEFEKAIAQTNRKLSGIETIFLLTSAETSFISSSIVRDIMRNGGDASQLVPKAVSGK